MEILGAVIAVLALLTGIVFWANGEITRVRTAVLAEQPELGCSIGSYSGNGSGLHAAIHNSGQVRAHDLALTFPTMGVVWKQPHLAKGDVARPHIPIADDAQLRTTKLTDPVATLSYADRFGQSYALNIPLTQAPRDDGRFNLGSVADERKIERPTLTARKLWRLRKEI